jgi:hypothetical protein
LFLNFCTVIQYVSVRSAAGGCGVAAGALFRAREERHIFMPKIAAVTTAIAISATTSTLVFF